MNWTPETVPLPPIKCGLCGHVRDAEPVAACPECGGKILRAFKKTLARIGMFLLVVLAASFAQTLVRTAFKTFGGE